VTGVIGGVQSAHAASDAAADIRAGNAKAQGTMTQGVNTANALYDPAAEAATGYVRDAADWGQQAVGSAVTGAQEGIKGAVTDAQGRVVPYTTAGAEATKNLSDLANQKFTFSQDDPSYQFRLQEGAKALSRSQAASGNLLGGAAAKSVARYGQNMASTEYQNAFNRFQQNRQTSGSMLGFLAGQGLNASQYAGNVGMQGAEYGGNVGLQGAQFNAGLGMNAAQYGGNARMWSAGNQAANTMTGTQFNAGMDANTGQANAQEHIGRANAWNSMLSGIGSGVDSALFGGFGGGGGFSLSGALSGVPRGGYGYGYGVDTSNSNPISFYDMMGQKPPGT
jgi:hypothetical protein